MLSYANPAYLRSGDGHLLPREQAAQSPNSIRPVFDFSSVSEKNVLPNHDNFVFTRGFLGMVHPSLETHSWLLCRVISSSKYHFGRIVKNGRPNLKLKFDEICVVHEFLELRLIGTSICPIAQPPMPLSGQYFLEGSLIDTKSTG